MPKKSPAKSGTSSSKLTNKSSTKAAARSVPTAAVKPRQDAGKSAVAQPDEAIAPARRKPAPDFLLPRKDGPPASLADFRGRKIVLFFYPKADTPGCTKEAIDFNRLKSAFDATGTDIVGISADPAKAQDRFCIKHDLGLPMISDEARYVIDAYGAWGEKSMYGRTFEGVLRTTVLVDQAGRIAQVWRNVRVDGHADAVLAAARALEPSAD